MNVVCPSAAIDTAAVDIRYTSSAAVAIRAPSPHFRQRSLPLSRMVTNPITAASLTYSNSGRGRENSA